MPEPHKKKIAIIGPPNVGKSTLFNKFSRSYSVVANYPQTTIETFRKEVSFAGGRYELIDTPGLFSLYGVSEDEAVARAVLLNEHPAMVIFCGDATNVKRTLIMLMQALEMELPAVFCLNKMDEAGRKGISIDREQLARGVGVPVTLTAAVHGAGLQELEEAVRHISPRPPLLRYTPAVEKALDEMKGFFPASDAPPRGLLLMLLLEEGAAAATLTDRHGGELAAKAEAVRERLYRTGSSLLVKNAVFKAREEWADALIAKAVRREAAGAKSFASEAARLSRHPFYGIPLLIGVLWATFQGVARISTALAAFLDALIFVPAAESIGRLAPNDFLREFLVGNFGVVTMGVFNAIGTVVPILLVFFLIINFLEEVGYLPNLGVLLNRMLAPMGLSGKAVMPMVLGFGCNTIATMASRMLETKKERLIASFLIALGVPCAVQLGILLAILATAPFSALLIVITAIVFTQVGVGLLLNRLIPTQRRADFIMDLPTFYAPDWRNIARKTYFRIKWFLDEALPMFMAASLFMFMLEKTGMLAAIERWAKPVVTGILTLPDKTTEVFILVLARREIGALHFKDMVDTGLMDYTQTVVGLVVITLFIPCASNTMVMVKELGLRWAAAINVAIIAIAVAVGGGLNFLMRLG
ncbi:MAG: ferrous iron transport protein B [Nitrospinae bacterium]|nr:ferrous iron transport protein B [Nitrospinota bacterium]